MQKPHTSTLVMLNTTRHLNVHPHLLHKYLLQSGVLYLSVGRVHALLRSEGEGHLGLEHHGWDWTLVPLISVHLPRRTPVGGWLRQFPQRLKNKHHDDIILPKTTWCSDEVSAAYNADSTNVSRWISWFIHRLSTISYYILQSDVSKSVLQILKQPRNADFIHNDYNYTNTQMSSRQCLNNYLLFLCNIISEPTKLDTFNFLIEECVDYVEKLAVWAVMDNGDC